LLHTVVVVPFDEIDRVYDEAIAKLKREDDIWKRIDSGEKVHTMFGVTSINPIE
jgi:regulator of RNase E activity RraA